MELETVQTPKNILVPGLILALHESAFFSICYCPMNLEISLNVKT